MASTYAYCNSNGQNSRGVAMVLALISAVVLSPLYVTRKNHEENSRFYETTKWNSGFLLPVVLGGLIIAIRTTSSSSSPSSSFIPSPDPSWVLRIGSSSWGLAGVLIMLMLVLSWQDSVQDFFWR
ncbi:hypothetical protein Pint_29135 [Pistacia integerrima]|uniref:Uncharacterized protein n=2 Tax=Pistacia TaxID=55512 RepID=A0ACC0ZU57_9ROSI|nr:hypothetical protein Pint_29135 [Pistacia integerrima]KAJ0075345.1 hypothetical protein Patl1_33668 [Pistacia atlantica]